MGSPSKSIGGSRSASASAQKVAKLNKLIDQLVQECGASFPGLASVVNGARKLLLQPAPSSGKQKRVLRRTT